MRFEICFYQCLYIIVSERTVLEGGSGGPPPEKDLVIFMQNGAIFDNTCTYGYICLDIMPQKEGRYKPFWNILLFE